MTPDPAYRLLSSLSNKLILFGSHYGSPISLIDLFFANNTEDIVCHGTLPKIADHEGVLASYKLTLEKPKAKTQKIYDYKNADIDGLTNFIKKHMILKQMFLAIQAHSRLIYSMEYS